MKTNKSVAKRFRRSGSGKIMHASANRRHNLAINRQSTNAACVVKPPWLWVMMPSAFRAWRLIFNKYHASLPYFPL